MRFSCALDLALSGRPKKIKVLPNMAYSTQNVILLLVFLLAVRGPVCLHIIYKIPSEWTYQKYKFHF